MGDVIPADFEMVTGENCFALLVDHQPGLIFNAGDISPGTLRNNAIALAKVLALHNIPTVITCAVMGPKGPMGPLLPEIAALFPDVEPIYRTKNNSYDDDNIRAAIEATGRKRAIVAGITGDFCAGLPAKSLAKAGYDVRLIIDASGNDSPMVQAAMIANLTQHGVKIQGWIAIACELNADWARPDGKGEGLQKIYAEHNPPWMLLTAIQDGHRENKDHLL